MHVITRKRLIEFADRHPETASALDRWYRLIKSGSFSSFAELRATCPTAVQVARLTVFDIVGDRVSLLAAVHYNRRHVYVRAVLTHAEYDEGRWKE